MKKSGGENENVALPRRASIRPWYSSYDTYTPASRNCCECGDEALIGDEPRDIGGLVAGVRQQPPGRARRIRPHHSVERREESWAAARDFVGHHGLGRGNGDGVAHEGPKPTRASRPRVRAMSSFPTGPPDRRPAEEVRCRTELRLASLPPRKLWVNVTVPPKQPPSGGDGRLGGTAGAWERMAWMPRRS